MPSGAAGAPVGQLRRGPHRRRRRHAGDGRHRVLPERPRRPRHRRHRSGVARAPAGRIRALWRSPFAAGTASSSPSSRSSSTPTHATSTTRPARACRPTRDFVRSVPRSRRHSTASPMRSCERRCTDQERRSLGSALDLVTALSRIAGQQAGRAGDQQFRLYVTLRPDARETLERSVEFVRDHENTVYHVGYPHSYRMGGGVPSIQFSLSADGLTADIDVDYRASKTPQSLFNGHLTSSNSDVRAGNNTERHGRRWNGFVNWWTELYRRPSSSRRRRSLLRGRSGRRQPRSPKPGARQQTGRGADCRCGRCGPGIPDRLADSTKLPRSAGVLRSRGALPCVADSVEMNPTIAEEQSPPGRLRSYWRRPQTLGDARHSLTEAMNPVSPWSPSMRVVKHAYEQDFTIVEAPTELGALYECGATPPRKFAPVGRTAVRHVLRRPAASRTRGTQGRDDGAGLASSRRRVAARGLSSC